jgi:hypothetical protein
VQDVLGERAIGLLTAFHDVFDPIAPACEREYRKAAMFLDIGRFSDTFCAAPLK